MSWTTVPGRRDGVQCRTPSVPRSAVLEATPELSESQWFTVNITKHYTSPSPSGKVRGSALCSPNRRLYLSGADRG